MVLISFEGERKVKNLCIMSDLTVRAVNVSLRFCGLSIYSMLLDILRFCLFKTDLANVDTHCATESSFFLYLYIIYQFSKSKVTR